MPIYEFECKKCKAVFEKLVFRSNQAIECKNCGSDKVERLLSACGIVSSSGAASLSGSSSSGCSSCSSHNCSTCR